MGDAAAGLQGTFAPSPSTASAPSASPTASAPSPTASAPSPMVGAHGGGACGDACGDARGDARGGAPCSSCSPSPTSAGGACSAHNGGSTVAAAEEEAAREGACGGVAAGPAAAPPSQSTTPLAAVLTPSLAEASAPSADGEDRYSAATLRILKGSQTSFCSNADDECRSPCSRVRGAAAVPVVRPVGRLFARPECLSRPGRGAQHAWASNHPVVGWANSSGHKPAEDPHEYERVKAESVNVVARTTRSKMLCP
eukprot:5634721-Prymnesium_polylepis.1